MAFAETANLAVKLTLGGNFTSQLKKATGDLKAFNKDASRGYKAGAQIGTGIKRGALLAAGGLGVLVAAIGKSVDAAGDFEAQLNTINTIAFKDAGGLKEIGDGIRTIAKKTGISLDDLTSAYYDLLSAGVKVTDAQAVLNDAVTLGVGGLATTAEAVDLLTTAYNAYGLDAKGAAVATDQFAQAVADGKVKASEIAATFANVASIAKAYNVGIDQIAASYGYLTAQGVPAAEVTTEMNRAIISLIKPSKALLKAQSSLGVNFTDIVKKKGLVPALEVLRKYSDKSGVPLIELLGRVEAVKYALQTTGPNAKGFAAELDRIRKSSGEAAAQMAEREKGLNFQLGILKALAKDAGITIGTALLPKLTPVVSALNDFINTHQGDIAGFGDQLAAAFTPEGVISGIKGITSALGPLIDLVKIAAAPVKAITQAFLSLPKEVQTVLIGAFAVNKLTGGLVTNAAGGIIEAIGKGLLGGIKAPLVNVSGGVVNVAGGVGGGIPGGGLPGAAAGAAGLSGAAALSIALPVLGLGLIGAVNSPLWVKNTTLNTKNENAGLTQPERAAQLYYTSSAADQAEMRKRISTLPTQADFDSGNAKLKAGITTLSGKLADDTAAVNASKATLSGKLADDTAATRAVTAAVHASRPIVTTNVSVSVSANSVTKTVQVTGRYGSPNGSRSKDQGDYGRGK